MNTRHEHDTHSLTRRHRSGPLRGVLILTPKDIETWRLGVEK